MDSILEIDRYSCQQYKKISGEMLDEIDTLSDEYRDAILEKIENKYHDAFVSLAKGSPLVERGKS